MEGADVGIFIAFLAGLLSFLSPCVLPLIPSYVSFLTGMSLDELSDGGAGKRTALVHSLLFVFGFSLVFVILGAGATQLGRMLNVYQVWLARIGGVIIIVFGLYLLGVLKFAVLGRDTRLQINNKPVGYVGSVLVGVAFSAGWAPCIGPILGSILTLAATRGQVGEGMTLLGSYSMGLAVPFVVAALAIDRFIGWFRRFKKYVVWVERVAGLLLIGLGLLLVTGYFTILATLLQGLTPDFLLERL